MTTMLESIKERVRVPAALALLGLSPDRNGKIHCPFHTDETPSCMIYDDHFYSFCCGKYGDVFDLVIALAPEISTLTDAVKFLNGNLDIEALSKIEPQKREVKDFRLRLESMDIGTMDHTLTLMKAKGWHRLFTTQDLRGWGVRASHTQLLIPHAHGGKVVGVKTRQLTTGEKSAWTGSTFSLAPYMPARYFGNPVVTIICEGESDTWALLSHYREEPVEVMGLPSGASSWKDEYAGWVGGREVWLMLDHDEAGDKAAEKIVKTLPKAQRVTLPENDVVDTLIEGWRLPRP